MRYQKRLLFAGISLCLLAACGSSAPEADPLPPTPAPFQPTDAPPADTQDEMPTQIPSEIPPTEAPPTAFPTAIPTDPPTAEPLSVILAQGQFTQVDAQHFGQGTAALVQQSDGSLTLTFTNFSVVDAPEMRVFLSPQSDPRTSAELGTDYLDLGPLQSISGDQTYTLPPGTDASRYRSVVIYCVPFDVVVSTAPF